jgi:hypothetical protein
MKSKLGFSIFLFAVGILFTSCEQAAEKKVDPAMVEKTNQEEAKVINQNEFLAQLEKHLDAVSNKDLETLKTTLSPYGAMQLILPGMEVIEGVDGFMNYHQQWFADTNGWTFETDIKSATIGEKMGLAIVETIYREPDRDGKPYFNRMIVSYDLEKVDGTWYVIKDHASSVEKSTDKE